jgi:ribose 5-phosphate isomerase B
MRIALGADHAGVALKRDIARLLADLEHTVEDEGTDSDAPVDYPDFAARVGHRVASGEAERGILICGTGLGMAMAANKVRGVRAAPVQDLESARLARAHNDANVLTLGARLLDRARALDIVRVFLETPFQGGRHERRLEKIAAIERDTSAAGE